jgi:hypothetical protein
MYKPFISLKSQFFFLGRDKLQITETVDTELADISKIFSRNLKLGVHALYVPVF